MPRMKHPDLDTVIDVPDDPGCVAVHVESGWELAPDLVQVNPALAPGEVEPETPKRRSKSTTD